MNYLKKYDNGMKLIINQNNAVRSVTVAVAVNVGSSFESAKDNGYSHFIEHLLFKGTAKRSALQISEAIEGIGGQINASTSKDMTLYYTKTSSEHLEKSIDLLSDLLFNSLFDETEIEREKQVVIEEILMGEDQPDEVCHDLIAKALYSPHSLGRPIAGTAKNINNATRESLVNFMRTYYVPERIAVSIAGNVDTKTAENLVNEYFVSKFAVKDASPVTLSKAVPKINSLKAIKNIEQCHISFATPAGRFNAKENIAFGVLNSMFGGGMSSRLFQSIRERHGLAYSVFSYLSAYDKNGYFQIYLGTNTKSLEKAVRLVAEEIGKIKREGYSDDEFKRAKEHQKGTLILSLENTMTIAYSNAKFALKTGTAFDSEKRIESINSLTREEIDDAIQKLFNLDNYSAAYVGRECGVEVLEVLKES